jgi:hypothetical protein
MAGQAAMSSIYLGLAVFIGAVAGAVVTVVLLRTFAIRDLVDEAIDRWIADMGRDPAVRDLSVQDLAAWRKRTRKGAA